MGRGLLFGGLDLAVDHHHLAVHFGLGGLGAAHGGLETTEAFLAEWDGGYLSCALMPGLVRFLFFVLPAFSEDECYDCI